MSADNNFEFDEKDGNFSKRLENTVGEREIVHYELFLLFPQFFQRAVQQTRKNKGLLVKRLYHNNIIQTSTDSVHSVRYCRFRDPTAHVFSNFTTRYCSEKIAISRRQAHSRTTNLFNQLLKTSFLRKPPRNLQVFILLLN